MLLPETPTGASALEDVTEHEPLLGPEGRYPSEEKRPDDAPTARTSVNDDLSDSEDEADDEESDDEQLPRPAAPALQAPARYRYLAPVLILLAIGAMALMVRKPSQPGRLCICRSRPGLRQFILACAGCG